MWGWTQVELVNAYDLSVGKQTGSDHLEEPDMDEMIILKLVFKCSSEE
jgi:hypothetical protein